MLSYLRYLFVVVISVLHVMYFQSMDTLFLLPSQIRILQGVYGFIYNMKNEGELCSSNSVLAFLTTSRTINITHSVT